MNCYLYESHLNWQCLQTKGSALQYLVSLLPKCCEVVWANQYYIRRKLVVCVNLEIFASINLSMNHVRFIWVNFCMLTHRNQIFKNDFVCNHYHLCKFHLKLLIAKFLPLTIYTIVLLYQWIFFGSTSRSKFKIHIILLYYIFLVRWLSSFSIFVRCWEEMKQFILIVF